MANSNAKWYLVQVVSNYELKVKEQLENRELSGNDEIEDIFVPMKTLISEKTGKARTKPLFPGYFFVKVEMTDDSWFVIRNTQYVTGIVGSSGQRTKPTPIPEEEILRMIERENETGAPTLSKADFREGDIVDVVSGPFAGRHGKVTHVNKAKGQLQVEMDMFEKVTDVPISISDVKIK